MRCPNCSAEVPSDATFCSKCGLKIGAAEKSTAQHLAGAAAAPRRISKNDPELDLWSGGFSAKAMINTWFGAGVLSVGALAAGILIDQGRYWWIGLLAVLAISLTVAAIYGYRRLAIRYRLTTQRFFHESGLLRRVTNRIECIDMDDITFMQGPFERMLGVGTIIVTSSDRTHPNLALRGIDRVKEVAAMIDDARRKERLRRGTFLEQV